MQDLQKIKRSNAIIALNDKIRALIDNDSDIKTAIINNPDYVDQLLKSVIVDELKSDIANKKALLQYDFNKECTEFLEHCMLKSKHTAKAYRYALTDWANWSRLKGYDSPLLITPEIADDYIYTLQKQGVSSATIRQRIGGLSAFFNALDRKSNGKIKNCFRGTRATPKKKAVKHIESEIPTQNLKLFKKDVLTIAREEQDKELQVMIYIMAFRGLRAGAFEHMTIHGNRFYTTSKGKDITGELPDICINALNNADLSKSTPFNKWTSAKVSSTFEYHISKLYKSGKIAYRYSCHDLRHFFALTDYAEHKDIYRLKALLNHASIQTTEIYLQGLGIQLK